jgi:hypothetical protein
MYPQGCPRCGERYWRLRNTVSRFLFIYILIIFIIIIFFFYLGWEVVHIGAIYSAIHPVAFAYVNSITYCHPLLDELTSVIVKNTDRVRNNELRKWIANTVYQNTYSLMKVDPFTMLIKEENINKACVEALRTKEKERVRAEQMGLLMSKYPGRMINPNDFDNEDEQFVDLNMSMKKSQKKKKTLKRKQKKKEEEMDSCSDEEEEEEDEEDDEKKKEIKKILNCMFYSFFVVVP